MKFFKLAIALAGIALFSACSNDVESFLEEGNGVRGYNNSSHMKPKPLGSSTTTPIANKPTTATTTTDQSTQSRGYSNSTNMKPKPKIGNGPVVSKPTTTTTTDQSTQSRGFNSSGRTQPKSLGSATTTPIANKPTTTSTNKN